MKKRVQQKENDTFFHIILLIVERSEINNTIFPQKKKKNLFHNKKHIYLKKLTDFNVENWLLSMLQFSIIAFYLTALQYPLNRKIIISS